jgi:hypothetical protein
VNALLAWADSTDPSQGNFLVLLLCAGAVIGVFILAAIVVIVNRRGGSRNGEAILTAAVFWGIVSFGSIVYAGVTQMKWAQEQTLELQSGYGDPTATPPGYPWVIWAGLGAVYLVFLVMAARKKAE